MAQFSLICGTAGRVAELLRMLRSLAGQSFRDFELLLIDQNSDDRVLKIIDSLPHGIHLRRITSSPGLCRALNLGLQQAAGEIVGFPDDDCWYEPDLLQQLANLFHAHPDWDGISVPAMDDKGRPSIARWDKHAGRLTKSNLGLRGCSTTVFYRRHVCQRVGLFDESIGAGINLLSPGSDMDYLHRIVRLGFHVEYQPQLMVRHPQTLPDGVVGEAGKRKRYQYGYGEGSIARKYSVPLWYAAGIIMSPLARAVKQAAAGKGHLATKEWLTFRGRMDGWLHTRPLR
jgi:glycosyltransferase involved in cell wall biosynthesis